MRNLKVQSVVAFDTWLSNRGQELELSNSGQEPEPLNRRRELEQSNRGQELELSSHGQEPEPSNLGQELDPPFPTLPTVNGIFSFLKDTFFVVVSFLFFSEAFGIKSSRSAWY